MTTWVRVDTKFIGHPKVLDIGPVGEALWLRGLCYAGEQLTDGFIPLTFVKRMGDMKGLVIAAKLVAAGLWDETEDGYQIHDYLDWQRSRDEVTDVSSKRAEAGRRGGKQKSSNLLAKRQQNDSNLSSKTLPDTDVDTDTQVEREETPLTPSDPTTPKPKRQPKLVATSFPESFEVTGSMRAWALGKYGLTDEAIDVKTEKFERYCRQHGKKYVDWLAAWQNFMEPKAWDAAAPPRGTTNGRPSSDDLMADAQAILDRRRQPENVIEGVFSVGGTR